MTRRAQQSRAAASLLACFLSLMLPLSASDQKPAADNGASKTAATPSSDIEQLKQMLLDQQRQINELSRELAEQKRSAPPLPAVHQGLGEVANTSGAVAPAPAPVLTPPSAVPPPQAWENPVARPLQLKIGDAFITPLGFMDMTAVSRSTNPGSGIGTNFGSIPYGNAQTGSLTETRLSIQNSRIGARVDAIVKNTKILGYWESDFLGQLGNPPNGGLAVSSNPYVFRMRLYWVDVTKGRFEFLAGQSWSLMTPNRKGISPLPGDVFYSQDVDVNYQAGLVWGRIPGFRFGFHPSDKVAVGIAFENSEPYVGGGNGGSAITAPSAIAGSLGTQVNNGSSVISAAALAPDIIAKIAFDPTRRFHFEIAGVEIANKIADPASTPAYQTFSKVGGGGSVNLSYALTKNLRVLTNNFYSAGGGRYIFGQAPDFVIRSNGSLSLVHSGSTVSGFELTAGKTLFYTYYGGVYIGKNLALDANGKTLIGYGPIASDGQNRAIQEITFGSNTTLMRDSKWGALNLMFQYSYLQRNPWLAAAGAPTDAHLSMGFVNFRYTLPGAAPALGK
ncbi:MAG: hypothetical protein ACLQKA_24675 [Bryobacteraceae bacterium]